MVGFSSSSLRFFFFSVSVFSVFLLLVASISCLSFLLVFLIVAAVVGGSTVVPCGDAGGGMVVLLPLQPVFTALFFSSQCRGASVFCTFLFFLLLQADLRWLLLLTIKRKNGTTGYGSRRWFSFFLCFCVASSVCFCSPVALVSAAPSSVSDDGRAAIVGGAAGDKAE